MLLVPNHRTFKAVKREEIRNVMIARVFNDIGPDDLLHRRFLIVQQPVLDFLTVVLGRHVEAFEVPLEQVLNGVNVFALHGAQPRYAGGALEMVSGDLPRFRRI